MSVDEQRVVEATVRLAGALPADHPALGLVTDVIKEMWDALTAEPVEASELAAAELTLDAYDELTTLLADWRRGIREWAEVDEAMKRAEVRAGKLGR